ncbi:MAG: serine/threonine protein kinase [Clostridia bacterium]|nr:serine/threonine protein kinase [Clostridia bacterium]
MDRIKKFEPLWGVWECDAVLGEGSFGRVYRAVRKEGERVYYSAVKHISVPANQQQLNEVRSSGFYNSDAEISKYFGGIVEDVQREVDFMYTLKGNANIVSYEDHLIVPKEDGIGCDIFIRMELLRSLNSIIKSNLTVEDAIKIGSDICSALEVCAKSRIVHRDIKPSNIFVNANGDYKLGDFGIAKVLNSATVGMSKKGTYFYMAPEIYKCEPANFTSDIYSLGIVLYRILNDNCLPFMPTNGTILLEHQEAALVKTMTGQPMPPPRNATPQLAAVILKACSFNMRNRFQTLGEFKKALNDAYLGKYVEQVPAVSEDTVKVDEDNTTPINAVFDANPAQAQQPGKADNWWRDSGYPIPPSAPSIVTQPLQNSTSYTVTQPLAQPMPSTVTQPLHQYPQSDTQQPKTKRTTSLGTTGLVFGILSFLCLIGMFITPAVFSFLVIFV